MIPSDPSSTDSGTRQDRGWPACSRRRPPRRPRGARGPPGSRGSSQYAASAPAASRSSKRTRRATSDSTSLPVARDSSHAVRASPCDPTPASCPPRKCAVGTTPGPDRASSHSSSPGATTSSGSTNRQCVPRAAPSPMVRASEREAPEAVSSRTPAARAAPPRPPRRDRRATPGPSRTARRPGSGPRARPGRPRGRCCRGPAQTMTETWGGAPTTPSVAATMRRSRSPKACCVTQALRPRRTYDRDRVPTVGRGRPRRLHARRGSRGLRHPV